MSRQEKIKIDDDFLKRVHGLARRGLTDAKIAEQLGISERAFYDYRRKYPKMAEALKKGKAPVDFDVESSLLKRALGCVETVVQRKVLPDGSEILTTTEKHTPPDVQACIKWLCLRCPEHWREVQLPAGNDNEATAEMIKQYLSALTGNEVDNE